VFTSFGGAYSSIDPTDVRPAAPYVATARSQALDAASMLDRVRAASTDPTMDGFLDAALVSVRSGADNLFHLEGYARTNEIDGYYRFSNAVFQQFQAAFDAVGQILA
jgi:hypothetical protein